MTGSIFPVKYHRALMAKRCIIELSNVFLWLTSIPLGCTTNDCYTIPATSALHETGTKGAR